MKVSLRFRNFIPVILTFNQLYLAVDCGPLPVPMNGSFSGDSTVFPNSGLFKCDPGFILYGSVSRTCQANGTWSGSSTACVGRSEATNVKTKIHRT